MGSAIFENLVSHGNVIILRGNYTDNYKQPLDIWQVYWEIHYTKYAKFIPYTNFLSIFLFMCNKLCVYAWNFGDVLVSVIAYALYIRMKTFIKSVQTEMNGKLYPGFWKDVVLGHEKLLKLIEKFNDFLSPLIFACTFANIFFLGITMYNFMLSSPSLLLSSLGEVDRQHETWRQVYQTWAFIHLIGRTLTGFVCCAKMNEWAHKMIDILEECPISQITMEVL